MDTLITTLITFAQEHYIVVLVIATVSEALSFIPAVKANGVFQLFFDVLTGLKNSIISALKATLAAKPPVP